MLLIIEVTIKDLWIKLLRYVKVSQREESQVTIMDQMKKFAIRSLYGFQTVIVYGMGVRLGIFDYLFAKGKAAGEVETVSLTLDELAQEIDLDVR